MATFIVTIVVCASAIWVYLDATKNNIGKIPGGKGMFNASAGAWATVTLLLWIIGFPAYLIKRNALIAAAQENPVAVTGRAKKIAVLVICCCLYLLIFNIDLLTNRQDNAQSSTVDQAADQSEQAHADMQNTSFNTSDKSINTNGNVLVAVNKIDKMGNTSVWDTADQASTETLTKSPYSAIGKLKKISGRVYKVEELPPGDFQGRWSELLLLANNPNSPLGSTTVDFMYNGDISKVRSGQRMTCAGYFVGTFESENAMGGKVEAVVLVGNDLR